MHNTGRGEIQVRCFLSRLTGAGETAVMEGSGMVPSVWRARELVGGSQAPGPLPVLAATPRGQLVLSFAWIGCSLLLLTAASVRISVAVELR